jgi:tetratricopeptide (TPR) repeat protein
MELTIKDLENLAAYFEGILTDPEQKTALEHRLATEPAFKKAAMEWHLKKRALERIGDAQQRIGDAQQRIRDAQQRSFLSEVDSQMPPIPAPKLEVSYLRWLKVAAAAAVVGFVAWVVLPLFSTAKPAYAAHFKPFPSDEHRKGHTVAQLRATAFEQYENGDYRAAMPNFKEAFDLDAQKDTFLLFYQGVAAVGCGDFATAQPILESLRSSQVIPVEHLPYYLGLTYANTGQNDRAKAALELALTTSEQFKQETIEALLQLNLPKEH